MGALTTKTRGALGNCICWPFRMHAQVTGVSRSAPTSDLQARRIARLCETRPSSSQKLRWLQVMDIETAIAASQSGVVAKGEEAPRSDCKESFKAVILMADRRRRPRTLALRQLQNPAHRCFRRLWIIPNCPPQPQYQEQNASTQKGTVPIMLRIGDAWKRCRLQQHQLARWTLRRRPIQAESGRLLVNGQGLG